MALRPGAAGSAVIKIMLGRQYRGGSSYEHYGFAMGRKRYNEAALRRFVGPLYAFMEAIGVLGSDISDSLRDYDADVLEVPEWIGIRKKNELADVFKLVWQNLREEKGGGVHEVVAKRKRAKGSLALTKEVALPGTIVVVKDEIGHMSPKEGLEELPVFPDNPQIGVAYPGVPPGGKLEILSKVRKIQNVAQVRVKVLETREEGEIFWITLKVSTQLEKPIEE